MFSLKLVFRYFPLYYLINLIGVFSVPHEPQRHYRAMTGKEISRMKRTDTILEEVYNMYHHRKFTYLYMKITNTLTYLQKRPDYFKI